MIKEYLINIKSIPVNSIVSILGTLAVQLFGNFDTPLQILIVFMSLDVITGTMQAFVNKELNSSFGKGLFKKAGVLICVIVGVQLDNLTGQAGVFRSMICLFFVSNEGISIIENLGKLGVTYPAFLQNALEQLQKGKEDESH